MKSPESLKQDQDELVCSEILNEVFEELMAAPIGGAINSYACEFSEHSIKLHFWDGRRFLLTVEPRLAGCSYDTATGNPID
jgi:hypothetical protein